MAKSLTSFAAENATRPGPKCALEKSKHRAAVEEGLKGGIPASVISRWLKTEYRTEISAGVINTHRRGDCRCQLKG